MTKLLYVLIFKKVCSARGCRNLF